MRKLFLITLLLINFGVSAAPRKPAAELFGLRLGMSEEVVHRKLKRVATQQKEEREEEEGGEQEVWILKKDSRYKYLLTRFNDEHRLILVTVVAQSGQVRYSDLGDIKQATVATDGINYSYKWKTTPTNQKDRATLLVARGSNSDYLTSYSLYFVR